MHGDVAQRREWQAICRCGQNYRHLHVLAKKLPISLGSTIITKTVRNMRTDYYTAVHWLGSALILCNEIAENDVSVIENIEYPKWCDDD